MIGCDRCHGTGILEAMGKDKLLRTLVLCSCDVGKARPWKLPLYSGKWIEHFTVSPPMFSLPKESSAQSSMDLWSAKLKVAEEFWQYHEHQRTWGVVFEPEPPKRWDMEKE